MYEYIKRNCSSLEAKILKHNKEKILLHAIYSHTTCLLSNATIIKCIKELSMTLDSEDFLQVMYEYTGISKAKKTSYNLFFKGENI